MTPFDEDYRELIERARDAVGELLAGSAPDSWLGLRRSYGDLRLALDRDDQDRERGAGIVRTREQQEKWERREKEELEAEAAWKRLSGAARESLLLNVLGDERLIIPELVSRMNAELGYSGVSDDGEKGARAVYGIHVRYLVMRMFRAGHLQRIAEPAPGAKIRHRYFRRLELDGPIAELEREYQEGGE